MLFLPRKPEILRCRFCVPSLTSQIIPGSKVPDVITSKAIFSRVLGSANNRKHRSNFSESNLKEKKTNHRRAGDVNNAIPVFPALYLIDRNADRAPIP